MFASRRIPLHVFYSAAQQATEVTPPHYEGATSISLERLRWAGAADGAEKIDLIVPLQLRLFGEVSLLLSVAIVMDVGTKVPQEMSGPGGVQWPPASYHDGALLPPAWLSMLH